MIGLGAVALGPSPALASDPVPIDEYRELMIVHPSVVDPFLNGGRSRNGGPNDEGAAWSLRHHLNFLVANLGTTGRNAFFASFFEQWLTTQIADNGTSIAARDPNRVSSLMLQQFSSIDPATGLRTFQLWKLPFELIAIVYRPDLRAADGSDAGELRFVYKLIGPDFQDVKFTLNMEYKVPTTYFDTLTWVHNFHQLSSLRLGSPAYLSTLERLTWSVTSGVFGAPPPKLGQIRTNELAFDGSATPVWQMREFVQQRTSRTQTKIIASSVENTPASSLRNTQTLADFIAANPVLSDAGTAFMKLKLPETLTTASGAISFLGGTSDVGTKWTFESLPSPPPALAADNLGLLTCNGCHEDNKPASDPMRFYHVSPEAPPGQDGRARLSAFLTTAVPGQANRPGELNRRKAEVDVLLGQPWTPVWIP